MSHTRSVYLFHILFLVATKLVNDTEGERCPVVVDFHAVVLVALHGAGVVWIVEDVAAIETHAPFPVMRRPLQLGIHTEDGTYVVDALYGLSLIERIKNETQVLRAA